MLNRKVRKPKREANVNGIPPFSLEAYEKDRIELNHWMEWMKSLMNSMVPQASNKQVREERSKFLLKMTIFGFLPLIGILGLVTLGWRIYYA